MHKLLWVQEYKKGSSFPLLLVHQYLIIVGGSYPMDSDKGMSTVYAHTWKEGMRG